MTIADRVKAEFENATKTISISTIAKRYRAESDHQADFNGVTIFWHFEDGSWIASKNRGKAHQYWTSTPLNLEA
jgi:hypothetical protein